MRSTRGFTLIELIVVIVVLAVLGATVLSRYANWAQAARISTINGLAGSVNSALMLLRSATAINGPGTVGTQAGITYVTLEDGTSVRMWNGYPDRWCDGIGMTQMGMSIPSGGCYLSSAAVPYWKYTFYGYGNGAIPNGDAGWRIETAPTPINCSVGYTYNGTGVPQATAHTSGC